MQPLHIKFLNLLNGDVQYVVPRWQRRYCWGQSDVERLVDDLLAIAVAGPESSHYGGTLLTFPEPGAAGVTNGARPVSGQETNTRDCARFWRATMTRARIDTSAPDGRQTHYN